MKKKIITFAAAIVTALSLSGCEALNSIFNNSSDISNSVPDNNSSDNNSTISNSGNQESNSSSSSDPDTITTDPQTVRCGDIIMENDKRTFDVEITCGNAFVVMFHYISSDNWRIENAIPAFRPLGVTDLKDILNDPIVGGGDLSANDFEFVGGIYKMKDEEAAKSLLGSLTNTYSFDEYWKNQKMAELVSTEGISAEEARPRVEEMFKNMGKNNNA